MSVKIRLARHGSNKNPIYFVVASDVTSKRDGDFLEKLGQYFPKAEKPADKLKVSVDRVQAWLAKGAQMTLTVKQLLQKQGTLGSN